MKCPVTGLTCLALLLSAISVSTAVDCSLTAVSNRLQNCASIQLSALLNQQNVNSKVSEACKSADCSIGCYTRVYEGCSSTGIFQVIDLKAYKVATRYVCQHSQDTLNGLQNCGLTTWTCFSDLINKIGSAVTQHSSSNATAYVSEYCRKLDCSIGCYTKVYEKCSSRGIPKVIDLKAYKVSARYACKNIQDAINGLQNCGMATWPCFSDFTKGLRSAFTGYSSSNVAMDLSKYCSAAAGFKACASSNPLTAGGPCTAVQAAVLTNIYDVYMSIEKCGIPQTNPLFTTYGFALDESTCGAIRMGMSLIVTVDIVMITVLRMFL